jgi:aerobic-type carbon monoxide dehydrogenase small subunit (CoxS/CutS family)
MSGVPAEAVYGLFPIVFLFSIIVVGFIIFRRYFSRNITRNNNDEEENSPLLELLSMGECHRVKGIKDFSWSNVLSFTLNGKIVEIINPDPSELLATYIRDKVGLKGTKLGCEEGGCGACSVVLQNPSGKILSANSCLRLLCANDGFNITTVEGIGSVQNGLSPEQSALVQHNGTQCGYCTPGWVTTMHALTTSSTMENKLLQPQDIDTHFDGNICRCTGYRPILSAFHSLCGNNNSNDSNGEKKYTVNCHQPATACSQYTSSHIEMEDIQGQECPTIATQRKQQQQDPHSVQINNNNYRKNNKKNGIIKSAHNTTATTTQILPIVAKPLLFTNDRTGKNIIVH